MIEKKSVFAQFSKSVDLQGKINRKLTLMFSMTKYVFVESHNGIVNL